MRIDNQDIVRTARELRDKENEQLHIRPWSRHRHFHVPAWLAAIPAAVIVGFFLGIWTQADKQNKTPLTALVDTIYIEVPTPERPQQKPALQAIPAASKPVPRHIVRTPTSPRPLQPALGRPLANDNIRYDLLVRN